MKNEDSLLDDASDLLGTLLLGAVLLWALKLFVYAYAAVTAVFWEVLKSLGLAALRAFNLFRRLFS